MAKFEYFKNGVGGQLMTRSGFDLSNLQSFNDLTILVQDNAPASLDVLRAAHKTMSSGERPIIQAILWACDYASEADQLSRGNTYRNLSSMGSEHLKTYFSILKGE